MGIDADIVEDIVVDQGQPEAEAARNPTNPITDPQSQIDAEEPAKDEKPADTEPPIPKGVQKRIDRAVRQKYEAEARAKMLEERLARLEQQSAPQYRAPQQDAGEPTIDKFENFDQYVAAKAEYIARKQIEATLSEREKRQMEAYEAAERQKTAESWHKRLVQATAEMPDFEDVLASSDVPMSPPMQQLIMESDVGPKLAYYLATHPDEASQIVSMPPIRMVAALGRIEERLQSQVVAKKPTSAPPPLKSVGGKASSKKSPADMTDAEYAKWRKSGKAA